MSRRMRGLVYCACGLGVLALCSLFALRAGEILSGYTLPLLAAPHWVYPLVWPLIVLLTGLGVSACEPSESGMRLARGYAVWLGLLLLWTVLFFRLGMVYAAVLAGLAAWGVLLLCMRYSKEVRPGQERLLVAPVIWLGYCVTLNLAIALMN